MAADVWDILDNEDIQSAIVVGHSMGGAVAQAMARQHPRRLAGLVLASTFACKQIAWWEKLFPYLAIPAIRLWGVQRFAELNGVFGTGGKRVDGPFINLIKRVFRTQANESMVAVSKTIFAFDSRPWLAELMGPVLLLFGDKDTVMPPHHGFILKRGLPNAQLFFCGNCGHAMFHTHTAWMVEKIEAYLEQMGKSEAGSS
jgi:pimeloyl-ACP methyl ester carboxylesterase